MWSSFEDSLATGLEDDSVRLKQTTQYIEQIYSVVLQSRNVMNQNRIHYHAEVVLPEINNDEVCI